jgi:hypothetical protein
MKYGNVTLGQVEAVWNRLGGEDGVQRFLAGNIEVVIKDHFVTSDRPFIPDGCKVESHKEMAVLKLTRKGDDLFLDGKKIELFLSDKQKKGTVVGNDIRKELEGKPVLNACHLDYLREHPDLIPDSWKVDEQGKTRYIFFWGSIYRRSVGNLRVRYLYWNDGGWNWSNRWLDDEWNSNNPAAVLAS